MWYVIQTKSGEEHRILELFQGIADRARYRRCFVPMFEDVRKKNGKAQITIRRFFPGYFFVETDDPDYAFHILKGIPEFTRLLGSKDQPGETIFIPVEAEAEAFLDTLLEDGLMRVSYVLRSGKGIAPQFLGPLEKYRNRITYLDVMRRRALVEVDLFGKRRKFKFGLWTRDDPPIHWIEEQLGHEDSRVPETAPLAEGIDIGIHPGDQVADTIGVWADIVFTVQSVDPGRRLLSTTYDIMGTEAKITLEADQVRKVRKGVV